MATGTVSPSTFGTVVLVAVAVLAVGGTDGDVLRVAEVDGVPEDVVLGAGPWNVVPGVGPGCAVPCADPWDVMLWGVPELAVLWAGPGRTVLEAEAEDAAGEPRGLVPPQEMEAAASPITSSAFLIARN